MQSFRTLGRAAGVAAVAAMVAGAGALAQRGGGTPIKPGEECPPGMTLTGVGNCRAPEFPVPSIVDYRPTSTLVTAVHMVPKAKYPAIDYHAHVQRQLTSQDALAKLITALDAIGVGIAVSADTLSGQQLVNVVNVINASPYKDRVRVLTGVSFQNVGPGWAERAIAQLETDLKAGAVGIGEIAKSFGLTIRKGTERLHVDDPDIDPFWDACARLNIPVFIHTAEPQEFFNQPDMHNERWLELALFRDRRNYEPGQVKFEELMKERDNMLRKHPKTRFVLAHLGWHANDLARLGKLFDEFPNLTAEMGAVLYDIGRQPRAARDFFVKYQDRIIFGKDTFEQSEFPYYWRVLETKDEYFDYYRPYHAFWKLYGIDLPDEVLKKVYYKNAQRITPGLPTAGFPK